MEEALSMGKYIKLREQEIKLTQSFIKEHQKRLKWTRPEIEKFQTNSLKDLLKHVYTSPNIICKLLDKLDLDIEKIELSRFKKTSCYDKN